MYHFWSGLKSKHQATLLGSFSGAMRRRFFGQPAKYIPDLFHDYMFDIPPQLPLPDRTSEPEISVAIVAGKLLYAEHEAGQLRDQRKLFVETIFCDPRAAELIGDLPCPLSAEKYGDNAVASEILLDVSMPLGDAVRASISDMFYFRCHSSPGGDYIGGVIDLFPLEVAAQLADQVIMEIKGGYDKTYGLPALRTVLGFDGNARLNDVLQQPADIWFDTSDMEQVFLHQRIQQKIIWRKNKINIVTPPTYEAYVAMIEAQWQFGYQRAMAGLARQATQSSAAPAYPFLPADA